MKAHNLYKYLLPLILLTCFYEPLAAQMALLPEMMPPAPTATQASRKKAATENKFYVKVYGYYGLLSPGSFSGKGAPSESVSTSYSFFSNTRTTARSSDYNFKDPFGSGFRVGGGIGYVINDFINIGLDGEYLLGNSAFESYVITTQNVTSLYSFTTAPPPPPTTATTKFTNVNSEYQYRIVNIIPNITFKAVSKPEYYIYNRLGVIIGIPTQLDNITTSLNTYPAPRASDFDEDKTTIELQKSIGLGYQAALGVQFRISNSLRGFVEVVASNVQLKSDGYEIKKREFRFKTGAAAEKSGETPLKDIGDAVTVSGVNLKIPVSSIGLGAGLVVRF